MATATKTETHVGHIVQIIGPVLDVQFEEGHLPEIYHALTVKRDNGELVVAEVQQHLGNNWVRAVAMSTTDGLRRGMEAMNTGESITVPVGAETLGRVFNVVGEPIDGKGPVTGTRRDPIHRAPPSFTDQSTTAEIFETGMKVVDLICPFLKGGKSAVFGVAGTGRPVVTQALIRNVAAEHGGSLALRHRHLRQVEADDFQFHLLLLGQLNECQEHVARAGGDVEDPYRAIRNRRGELPDGGPEEAGAAGEAVDPRQAGERGAVRAG